MTDWSFNGLKNYPTNLSNVYCIFRDILREAKLSKTFLLNSKWDTECLPVFNIKTLVLKVKCF